MLRRRQTADRLYRACKNCTDAVRSVVTEAGMQSCRHLDGGARGDTITGPLLGTRAFHWFCFDWSVQQRCCMPPPGIPSAITVKSTVSFLIDFVRLRCSEAHLYEICVGWRSWGGTTIMACWLYELEALGSAV